MFSNLTTKHDWPNVPLKTELTDEGDQTIENINIKDPQHVHVGLLGRVEQVVVVTVVCPGDHLGGDPVWSFHEYWAAVNSEVERQSLHKRLLDQLYCSEANPPGLEVGVCLWSQDNLEVIEFLVAVSVGPPELHLILGNTELSWEQTCSGVFSSSSILDLSEDSLDVEFW